MPGSDSVLSLTRDERCCRGLASCGPSSRSGHDHPALEQRQGSRGLADGHSAGSGSVSQPRIEPDGQLTMVPPVASAAKKLTLTSPPWGPAAVDAHGSRKVPLSTWERCSQPALGPHAPPTPDFEAAPLRSH